MKNASQVGESHSFTNTSLAVFVLANLNGGCLFHCKVPPLLSSTGHLGNGIGRDGACTGGTGAGVGGEEGEWRTVASILCLHWTNSDTTEHIRMTAIFSCDAIINILR